MRRVPFEVWLFVIVLVFNAYALFVPTNSLLLGWFQSDDAFYYFKTAQNAAEGHGITFDQLGRDSGFHPLWMMVCIPVFSLARFDVILPLRVIALISILLSAGTAVILYLLGKRYLHPAAAGFLAIFFAFYPNIHAEVVEMGMEAGISAFFIALLLYRVVQATDEPAFNVRQGVITGLIGALTILARLDNVFLVAVLGAWLVIRPARLRYLLTADILLIFLGVLWSYFTRVGFGPHYAGVSDSSYWMAAAALALRIPIYYLLGTYNRPTPGWAGLARLFVRSLAAAGIASLALAGVMIGMFALRLFPGFPRLTLAYEAGFALAAVLVTRLLFWFLSRSQETVHPVKKARSSTKDEETAIDWPATLTRAVCFFAPIGLVMVAYMGLSLGYFGTPAPVSGQIKRWWGTLPNVIYGQPVNDLHEFLGLPNWSLTRSLMSWPTGLPELARVALYGALVLALVWRQRRRLVQQMHRLNLFPLFAGCFIQIVSYTGTGYLHMRGWYWVAQMMLTTLLLGVLLDALLCQLQPAFTTRLGKKSDPSWKTRTPMWVAGALSLVIILMSTVRMVKNMPLIISAENTDAYVAGIRLLEKETEPGSLIGSTGGGVIAYFIQDRTVVNLDGLMNTREYFQALKDGTASQYLDNIGLDYVYTGEYAITFSDPYFQFKGHLKKVKEFGGSTLFQWVPE